MHNINLRPPNLMVIPILPDFPGSPLKREVIFGPIDELIPGCLENAGLSLSLKGLWDHPGNGRPGLVEQMRISLPDLKCLFMSGHIDDIITDRGFLTKGISFIQKPFSLISLAAKVKEVLEQKSLGDE